jgi:hypothetical protein
MKTDTVGEWAVCVCAVCCVLCAVCVVCVCVMMIRLRDTGTTVGTGIIIPLEDVLLHYLLSTQSTFEVPKS